MTTLVLEKEPAVVSVAVTDERLTVELDDGRSIAVPLQWYPRLVHASPQERDNWQLLGDGYAIEWPDLDEHIRIEGLLAGRAAKANIRLSAGWRLIKARLALEVAWSSWRAEARACNSQGVLGRQKAA
jgi:hypothetical protein